MVTACAGKSLCQRPEQTGSLHFACTSVHTTRMRKLCASCAQAACTLRVVRELCVPPSPSVLCHDVCWANWQKPGRGLLQGRASMPKGPKAQRPKGPKSGCFLQVGWASLPLAVVRSGRARLSQAVRCRTQKSKTLRSLFIPMGVQCAYTSMCRPRPDTKALAMHSP